MRFRCYKYPLLLLPCVVRQQASFHLPCHCRQQGRHWGTCMLDFVWAENRLHSAVPCGSGERSRHCGHAASGWCWSTNTHCKLWLGVGQLDHPFHCHTCPTPSLRKWLIKMSNFLVCSPFAWAHEGFLSKCTVLELWKSFCYRTIIYTVWRHVCVNFSTLKIYRLGQWRG